MTEKEIVNEALRMIGVDESKVDFARSAYDAKAAKIAMKNFQEYSRVFGRVVFAKELRRPRKKVESRVVESKMIEGS